MKFVSSRSLVCVVANAFDLERICLGDRDQHSVSDVVLAEDKPTTTKTQNDSRRYIEGRLRQQRQERAQHMSSIFEVRSHRKFLNRTINIVCVCVFVCVAAS